MSPLVVSKNYTATPAPPPQSVQNHGFISLQNSSEEAITCPNRHDASLPVRLTNTEKTFLTPCKKTPGIMRKGLTFKTGSIITVGQWHCQDNSLVINKQPTLSKTPRTISSNLQRLTSRSSSISCETAPELVSEMTNAVSLVSSRDTMRHPNAEDIATDCVSRTNCIGDGFTKILTEKETRKVSEKVYAMGIESATTEHKG